MERSQLTPEDETLLRLCFAARANEVRYSKQLKNLTRSERTTMIKQLRLLADKLSIEVNL